MKNKIHLEKELAMRADAVRQANANISLEGFTLDTEIIELNKRFIAGDIDMNEKLLLIKKLYNDS